MSITWAEVKDAVLGATLELKLWLIMCLIFTATMIVWARTDRIKVFAWPMLGIYITWSLTRGIWETAQHVRSERQYRRERAERHAEARAAGLDI